jgi:hypothetical protein
VTASEASALLLETVRELSATRAERDAWRLLACAVIQDASELRRELEMVDERQRLYRGRLQDERDVWLDQTDLRREAA